MATTNLKQAAIFAGGRGTRMGDMTEWIPKPLLKAGDDPLIVHVMRQLAESGIDEFIILGGHLYEKFSEYFLSKCVMSNGGYTIEPGQVEAKLDIKGLENVKIVVVNTGESAGTAERLMYVKDMLDDDFVVTYGDTCSDVDITDVENKYLEDDNVIMTVTGVPYKERFGLLQLDDEGNFISFAEKSASPNEFVNGGFIVCNKEIFNYYPEEPFDFSVDIIANEEMASKMSVYKHYGYWHAVDTITDLEKFEEHLKEGEL